MWIKEPPRILKDSLSQNVNFLYKKDKIYIMDNHLCAGWVWLNYLNTNDSHNLFHIDRHYDLSTNDVEVQKLIIDENLNLSNLTFDEYCSLSFRLENYSDYEIKLFQWDNYIGNLHKVYPSFFNETYFACHESGDMIDGFVTCEPTFELLPENISYWINREKEKNWIVNLDLDYFFLELGDETIQAFSDEYIISVARSIKKAIDNISVLTICLSPECCGGWREALRINEIVCEILEIDFKLKDIEFDD